MAFYKKILYNYLGDSMHSNNLICDILEYIDKYLNTKIEIQDLEYKYYYNRFYIMKLFKKEIGISITDYINKLRIYNSIKELKDNKLIINIALNNGFYSQEYYSEIFKKEIGISPKKYQKIINRNYLYDNTIILNNIIEIKKLIDKTNKYKEKRKREVLPVKKLSIFK